MILKKKNINKDIKNVVEIAQILLNKREIFVSKLASIIYKLYKISTKNKKLLKELLLAIVSRPIKKLLKELISAIASRPIKKLLIKLIVLNIISNLII